MTLITKVDLGLTLGLFLHISLTFPGHLATPGRPQTLFAERFFNFCWETFSPWKKSVFPLRPKLSFFPHFRIPFPTKSIFLDQTKQFTPPPGPCHDGVPLREACGGAVPLHGRQELLPAVGPGAQGHVRLPGPAPLPHPAVHRPPPGVRPQRHWPPPMAQTAGVVLARVRRVLRRKRQSCPPSERRWMLLGAGVSMPVFGGRLQRALGVVSVRFGLVRVGWVWW